MKYLIKYALSSLMAIWLMTPVTVWSLTDPHCTDGGCTPFELECLSSGNAPVCLNHNTEHAVTLCINPHAASKLMENHPDACRGTCDFPTVCNDPSPVPDTSEDISL